jgi:hypothetical protein
MEQKDAMDRINALKCPKKDQSLSLRISRFGVRVPAGAPFFRHLGKSANFHPYLYKSSINGRASLAAESSFANISTAFPHSFGEVAGCTRMQQAAARASSSKPAQL